MIKSCQMIKSSSKTCHWFSPTDKLQENRVNKRGLCIIRNRG